MTENDPSLGSKGSCPACRRQGHVPAGATRTDGAAGRGGSGDSEGVVPASDVLSVLLTGLRGCAVSMTRIWHGLRRDRGVAPAGPPEGLGGTQSLGRTREPLAWSARAVSHWAWQRGTLPSLSLPRRGGDRAVGTSTRMSCLAPAGRQALAAKPRGMALVPSLPYRKHKRLEERRKVHLRRMRGSRE